MPARRRTVWFICYRDRPGPESAPINNIPVVCKFVIALSNLDTPQFIKRFRAGIVGLKFPLSLDRCGTCFAGN